MPFFGLYIVLLHLEKNSYKEKKKLLCLFFLEVEKPSAEISPENKNGGFPQKWGKLKALGFTWSIEQQKIGAGKKDWN